MNVDLVNIEILRDRHSRTHVVYNSGHKLMHAVAILDGAVKLVRLPLEERRYMAPLLWKAKPYPLARAVRALKRVGREAGITDAAAAILQELS